MTETHLKLTETQQVINIFEYLGIPIVYLALVTAGSR